MENKAYNFVLNEILSKVLELSENPSQFAEYLTQQIRELVGARTIVIALKEDSGQTKIFSVFPVRRTNWANQEAVLKLAERTFDFKSVKYLGKDAEDANIRSFLATLEINQTIAIPLIAANRLVGSILLLDIMDPVGMDSVITLLHQLSGVFALVIRNASLYQNMEDLVKIRTEELLQQNVVLLEREQQLMVANEEYEVLNEELLQNIRETEAINAQLKEAIARAEKSEMQARDILQTAMDGYWIVDKQGRFLDVNEVAHTMIGYSREEMLQMKIADIEVLETPEIIQARIDKINKTGEDRFESKHRCKDGSIISVETSTKVQKNKNTFVCFVHDITDRKKAEEHLKESEENLRKAQQIAHIGSWKWTIANDKAYWSEELFHIHDLEPQPQAPGFAEQDALTTPESREKLKCVLAKSLQNGEPYEIELDIISPYDKSIKHTIAKGEPDFDTDGEIIGFHGTLQDITDRKKAEEALRRSEERFSLAMKASNDGLFDWNLETNEIYYSPGWKRMLGYEDHELPNDFSIWENTTDPEDVKRSWEMQQRLILKQIDRFEIEFKMKHKAGHWVDILSRAEAIFNNSGKAIRIVGTHTNITDHKHAEAELIAARLKAEKSEDRMNLVIKASNDAPWDWDLVTNEIIYSRQWWQQLGYASDELTADSSLWERLLHPDDQTKVNEIFRKALELEEESYSLEFRLMHKKGHYVPILTRGIITYDLEKKAIRVTGSNMDLTERKLSEEKIIKAKEKAEESDRLKSAFLANMSHEIRTPMNGILGFSELLRKPGLTGEQQQEYISLIQKSGDRMLNIINDIVDISKIEAGLVELLINESNINDQTEFVYTFFKPQAEAKGLKLSCSNGLADEDSLISTDKEKVYAILTNLVKNAIKYTDSGTIEFGYHKKEGPQTAPLLEFYVKDTGIGVPSDRQQAIFDRFVQADIADTRAFQGAGLGLSISKAYVEMLGGKIWVESEEGKGSEFYFTIPYLRVQKNEKTENSFSSTTVATETIKNIKILLVEDDETSEMLLRLTLGAHTNSILKATTGVEAIKACHQNPDIDLILMDIKMPVMDGLEATRQIRQFNKDVVIIAQTAFGLSGDREMALAAGCNDYISKPINLIAFKGLLDQYF